MYLSPFASCEFLNSLRNAESICGAGKIVSRDENFYIAFADIQFNLFSQGLTFHQNPFKNNFHQSFKLALSFLQRK